MKRVSLTKKRKELHLKSKDVAKSVGINPAHYSRIETGKNNPSLDIAIIIAKFYKVEVAEFENLFKKDDNK